MVATGMRRENAPTKLLSPIETLATLFRSPLHHLPIRGAQGSIDRYGTGSIR